MSKSEYEFDIDDEGEFLAQAAADLYNMAKHGCWPVNDLAITAELREQLFAVECFLGIWEIAQKIADEVNVQMHTPRPVLLSRVFQLLGLDYARVRCRPFDLWPVSATKQSLNEGWILTNDRINNAAICSIDDPANHDGCPLNKPAFPSDHDAVMFVTYKAFEGDIIPHGLALCLQGHSADSVQEIAVPRPLLLQAFIEIVEENPAPANRTTA